MSPQRRTDNRVDVDWVARVGKRGIGVAKGRVQNASISGIYVETTLALSTGDHVLLELQIDIDENSRPILCEALIARRVDGSQRRSYGYGMQFTRIDEEALQQMLTLITQLWADQHSPDANAEPAKTS